MMIMIGKLIKTIRGILAKAFMFFRRHIAWANVFVIVIEVVIAFVVWFSGVGIRDTFGNFHSYIFLWITIIIATIAALNSVFASITAHDSFLSTRKALELTRATQRPFLNVDQFGVNWSRNDGKTTSVKEFIFGLCNTGSFPADQVSVLMKVSKNNLDNQQRLFLDSEEIPTICFPSDEIHNRHFIKVDEKEKLEVELKGELRVLIEIEYKNKLTQETHKTNRSYLVQYNGTTKYDPIPLPKEDYWN